MLAARVGMAVGHEVRVAVGHEVVPTLVCWPTSCAAIIAAGEQTNVCFRFLRWFARRPAAVGRVGCLTI
jgi:hypothetical protein